MLRTALQSFGRSLRPISRQAATRAEAQADTTSANAVLKLSLATPYETIFSNQTVHMVVVPGGSGNFGILANHVPTVAELHPGVVSVIETEGQGQEKKFFVPAGFAVVNAKSELTISAVEAIPIADLDKDAAQQALTEYQAKVNATSNELEKARAQVGADVSQAIVNATS